MRAVASAASNAVSPPRPVSGIVASISYGVILGTVLTPPPSCHWLASSFRHSLTN